MRAASVGVSRLRRPPRPPTLAARTLVTLMAHRRFSPLPRLAPKHGETCACPRQPLSFMERRRSRRRRSDPAPSWLSGYRMVPVLPLRRVPVVPLMRWVGGPAGFARPRAGSS